jgi:hypothetical protein
MARIQTWSPPAAPGTADHLLVARLAACGRRVAARLLLGRLLVLGAAGALYLLCFVAADHNWPGGLPRPAIQGSFALWTATLAIASAALLTHAFARRVNPLFAARILERSSGIRHNSVVNALLLRTAPGAAYARSAATAQADRDIADGAAGARVGEPALRVPLAVCSVVLAAWLAYGVLSPKPAWTSLARFFGAAISAPTATWLERVQPGPSDIIRTGQPLEFEFRVGGRPAERVQLDLLDGHGPDIAASYELKRLPASGDRWSVTLAPHEVMRDITYRCTANDATLTETIPVLPSPAIASVVVHLVPPAYTGRQPHTVSDPDLDVLAGTHATFRVQANTPARDAVFVLNGERETRTRMTVAADDPCCLGLATLLTYGGKYRIEFSDKWGWPLRDPPEYDLIVRPDAPPEVDIVTPSAAAAPAEVGLEHLPPELVAVARDDVGLAGVSLVLARQGTEESRALQYEPGPDARQASARVPVADLGLRPGERTELWLEARDNHVSPDGRPEPQTGRSRVLTIIAPPAAPAASRPASPAEQRPGSKPAGPGGQPDPDGETQAVAVADAADDGADAAALSPELAEELERFLEEHGEMASDVREQMRARSEPRPCECGGEGCEQCRGDSGQAPGDGPQQSDGPNPASQPAGEPQPDQPAPGAGPSPDANEAAPPNQAGSSTASQPADEPTSGAPDTSANEEDAGLPGSGGEPSADHTGAPSSAPLADPSEGPADPALPEGPAPDSSASPLSEGLADTVDLLEMLGGGEELTEQMLLDLGWPAEKAAAFVRALQQLHELSQRGGPPGRLRTLRFDTSVGDARLQAGGGLAAEAGTRVDPGGARPDDLPRIAPPADQEVPADLRAILDAYYRALAETSGQAAP